MNGNGARRWLAPPDDRRVRWWVVTPPALALLAAVSVEEVRGEPAPLDPRFYIGGGSTGPQAGQVPFAGYTGPTVAVSGILEAPAPGALDLDLWQVEEGTAGGRTHLGKVEVRAGEPFSIAAPVGFGPLQIEGFQDVTSDGPSLDDPFGRLEIVVGAEPTADLVLRLEEGAMAALLGDAGPGQDAPEHVEAEPGAPGGEDHPHEDAPPGAPDENGDGGFVEAPPGTPGGEDHPHEDAPPGAPGGDPAAGIADAPPGTPGGADHPHVEAPPGAPGGDPAAGIADAPPGTPGGAAHPHVEAPPGAPGGDPGAGAPGAGADPFAGIAGQRVRLSGTIIFDDPTVLLDMDVFKVDPTGPGGRSLAGKHKVRAGAFSLAVPASFGAIALEVFLDPAGDGPTPGDAFAACPCNPVSLTKGDVRGIEIRVARTAPVP